jgi:hypothetical protein
MAATEHPTPGVLEWSSVGGAIRMLLDWWRTTSQVVRWICYRRVKVRWVTPLGDETASML